MYQPFGLLRFYELPSGDDVSDLEDLTKWVHNNNRRSVSPARVPILWNNKNRLPQFQLFTETSFDPITVFKVIDYNNTSSEVDFASDIADIEKISANAYNKAFNAWVYYASSNLSESMDDGLYYIVIGDGTTTYYSNVFKLENETGR